MSTIETTTEWFVNTERDFDKECREVWTTAWYSTARAGNCSTKWDVTDFADECLRQYKKRFKPIGDLK